MKIKVLTRNPQDYVRETKRDIHKGKPIITQALAFDFYHSSDLTEMFAGLNSST